MERIWIYQANRFLNEKEEAAVLQALESFTSQWRAHGKALSASAEIRYGLFVILRVDESVAPPTGCSIDKSVHLLKELETELSITFFDRMLIAYRKDGKVDGEIALVTREQFEQLIADGVVDEETIVFNNMIQRYDELATSWEVPLRQSWHAKVFS